MKQGLFYHRAVCHLSEEVIKMKVVLTGGNSGITQINIFMILQKLSQHQNVKKFLVTQVDRCEVKSPLEQVI
jgi:hypothetical protein